MTEQLHTSIPHTGTHSGAKRAWQNVPDRRVPNQEQLEQVVTAHSNRQTHKPRERKQQTPASRRKVIGARQVAGKGHKNRGGKKSVPRKFARSAPGGARTEEAWSRCQQPAPSARMVTRRLRPGGSQTSSQGATTRRGTAFTARLAVTTRDAIGRRPPRRSAHWCGRSQITACRKADGGQCKRTTPRSW